MFERARVTSAAWRPVPTTRTRSAPRCSAGLTGAMNRAGSNLASYLLFEETFCRALIDLGYQDTSARAAEVRAFFEG